MNDHLLMGVIVQIGLVQDLLLLVFLSVLLGVLTTLLAIQLLHNFLSPKYRELILKIIPIFDASNTQVNLLYDSLVRENKTESKSLDDGVSTSYEKLSQLNQLSSSGEIVYRGSEPLLIHEMDVRNILDTLYEALNSNRGESMQTSNTEVKIEEKIKIIMREFQRNDCELVDIGDNVNKLLEGLKDIDVELSASGNKSSLPETLIEYFEGDIKDETHVIQEIEEHISEESQDSLQIQPDYSRATVVLNKFNDTVPRGKNGQMTDEVLNQYRSGIQNARDVLPTGMSTRTTSLPSREFLSRLEHLLDSVEQTMHSRDRYKTRAERSEKTVSTVIAEFDKKWLAKRPNVSSKTNHTLIRTSVQSGTVGERVVSSTAETLIDTSNEQIDRDFLETLSTANTENADSVEKRLRQTGRKLQRYESVQEYVTDPPSKNKLKSRIDRLNKKAQSESSSQLVQSIINHLEDLNHRVETAKHENTTELALVDLIVDQFESLIDEIPANEDGIPADPQQKFEEIEQLLEGTGMSREGRLLIERFVRIAYEFVRAAEEADSAGDMSRANSLRRAANDLLDELIDLLEGSRGREATECITEHIFSDNGE